MKQGHPGGCPSKDTCLTREGACEPQDRRKHVGARRLEAMRRALYKPATSLEGIIFPLLDVSRAHSVHVPHRAHQASCAAREAFTVAPVLPKVRMPLMDSTATLARFANMDRSGSSSFLFREAVDALSLHFIRLRTRTKPRPAERMTPRCSPCGGASCSCFASSK